MTKQTKEKEIEKAFLKKYNIGEVSHKIILKSKMLDSFKKEISVELLELIKHKIMKKQEEEERFFSKNDISMFLMDISAMQRAKSDTLHVKFAECTFYFLEYDLYNNPCILTLYEYLLGICRKHVFVRPLLMKILNNSPNYFELLRSSTVSLLLDLHRTSCFELTFLIPSIKPTEILMDPILRKGDKSSRKILYEYFLMKIRDEHYEFGSSYTTAIGLDDFEKLQMEQFVGKYFQDCPGFYALILNKQIKLNQRCMNVLCTNVINSTPFLGSLTDIKIAFLRQTGNKDHLTKIYQMYLLEHTTALHYGKNISGKYLPIITLMTELSIHFDNRNILNSFINLYPEESCLKHISYVSDSFPVIRDLLKFLPVLEEFDSEILIKFLNVLNENLKQNQNALGKNHFLENLHEIYRKIKKRLGDREVLGCFLKILSLLNSKKKKNLMVKEAILTICVDFYRNYDFSDFIEFYVEEIDYSTLRIALSIEISDNANIQVINTIMIHSMKSSAFYEILNYFTEMSFSSLSSETLRLIHARISSDLTNKDVKEEKLVMDVNYCSMLYFLRNYEIKTTSVLDE